MLEESIRKIRETEARAEEEKNACRARLQRMLAETENQAAALSAQARETLRQEREALLDQAEKEAARTRDAILRKTADACDLLRAQARQNSPRAIEIILSKEV